MPSHPRSGSHLCGSSDRRTRHAAPVAPKKASHPPLPPTPTPPTRTLPSTPPPQGGGARSAWLISCRNSDSIPELAQLLLGLEEAAHSLQQAKGIGELHELKPWHQEGHEYIGKPVRRFFAQWGASDGTVTGWLPAEGADAALWHIVHGDDADEEV